MLREGLLQYWWLLYRHAKLLDQPTDIYRNVEDAFTLKHGDLHLTGESVHVDIGSGSSPVPTLLYQRHRSTTYATELDPLYLQRQRHYAKILGLSKENRFITQAEDATRLSFADQSVDFLTAISAIEHFPGEGDMRAIYESARVLRSGGRAVVTVPTDVEYQEQQTTFEYAGFVRRYDPPALRSRLSHPDLKLIDEIYMVGPPEDFVQEFHRQFEDVLHGQNPADAWYKNGWLHQYSEVSILITLGFIHLSKQPAGSYGACLVFEKR